jgi:hypothetical protein
MGESITIQKIYEKYPKLFPKNSIFCNSGWLLIIDQLCSTIQIYIDNEIYEKKIQPEIVCIKEKFGILNVEIIDSDEIVDLIIRSTETMSNHLCEYCGEHGDLYCSLKHRNWSHFKTLCLDHAIEFYYYRLYKEQK